MRSSCAALIAIQSLLVGLSVGAAQAQGAEPVLATPPAAPASADATPASSADLTAVAAAARQPEPAVAPAAPALPAATPAAPAEPEKPKETPWYEKLKVRGYSQFRYNRLPSFNANDRLVNAQGDRYIGKGNGFGIRRARVILYGDVHERVSVYLQTDFASVVDGTLHVANVRDWYTDLFFDKAKTFRLRVGQSKVPFGFENLQSSQNRLPLDRNDALNSAVKDERDMGVYLYWAPAEIRKRFKHLVDGGLKGSGDYGVVGIGAFNGQTANRPALADHMHGILRVTWPFLLGEQFLELGGGGYYGKYRVAVSDDRDYAGDHKDARGFATVVLYPQPFGLVLEGNYGVGPERDKRASSDDLIVVDERKIYGGYAQVMFKIDDVLGTDALIPFARATYYRGGKKFETNAPGYLVKEIELGVEWQIMKPLEVVLAYDLAERTSSSTHLREKGHITRVQLQVNY